MKRTIIVTSVIAAAGAAALFGLRYGSDPETKLGPPENPGEVEQLRAELRTLEREMRALPSRAAAVARAETTRAAVAAAEAPPPPSSAEAPESRPNNRELVQQVATNCDARLATEPRDAAWSRETVATIHSAVSRLSPSARVLSADCASTVCKTVLESDTPNTERDLLSALAAEPPFASGTLYQYDRSGQRPRATLYVAREGHRLDPENAPPPSDGPPSEPTAVLN